MKEELSCEGCGANEWVNKVHYRECVYCGTTRRNYGTSYVMDEKFVPTACSGIIPRFNFGMISPTGEHIRNY